MSEAADARGDGDAPLHQAETAAHFEKLFEHSGDGILVTRPDGRVVRANPAACRLLGRSEAEIRALGRHGLIAPDATVEACLRERERTGVARGEIRFLRPDGSEFPADVTTTLIPGDPPLANVVFRDVSDRKRIEEEARVRHAQELAEVERVARLGSWTLEVSTGAYRMSDELYRIFGRSAETGPLRRGDPLWGGRPFLVPGDRERYLAAAAHCATTGTPFELDLTAVLPDGTRRSVLARGAALRDGDGTIARLRGTVLDVDDRKRAEEELRRSEERARLALDAAGLGSFRHDLVHDVFSFDARAAAQHGVAPGTLPLGEAVARVHPEDRPALERSMAETVDPARAGAEPRSLEFRILRPDGEVRWLHCRVLASFEGEGTARRPVLVVGTTQDVTERRRAEEELRASRRRAEERAAELQALFDTVPACIWVARDPRGDRIESNRFAAELLRSEPGQNVSLTGPVSERPTNFRPFKNGVPFPPEELPIQRSARQGVDVRDFEYDMQLDGGAVRHLVGSATPLRDERGAVRGSIGAFVDITDRVEVERALRASEQRTKLALTELEQALEATRRTEEKFRQAQKMEAVGRLAGGIAHDFNNVLTVILAHSELGQMLRPDDPLRVEMEEINKAGRRAAQLTAQLLAFSRKQVLEPRNLCLNDVVRGVDRMLRRLLSEAVELTTLLQPDLRLCRVDPGQVEQVLVNLVVNARDAMEDGGRLTIETANVFLDGGYVVEHPEVSPGPHVLLSVTDTGVGMDQETRAHLFEPFYTTKPKGQGTGLGLSTVYGIVRQSGGSIWVYSEPGQGTTFKIYLPVAEGPADAARTTVPDRRARTGSETILVVEDDEQVRSTVHGILRRAGYHVIEASNGGEALLVCEQHGGKIQLLLSDVVMPRLNGRQLAERLRKVRPELRVLFMSGYTENAIVHHGVLDSGVDFVAKPLTAETLLPKVRALLDRPVSGDASGRG